MPEGGVSIEDPELLQMIKNKIKVKPKGTNPEDVVDVTLSQIIWCI